MVRKLIRKVYDLGTLSSERRDYFQKKIRDVEWSAIRPFIKPNSRFIDVGCGAGYNLVLARQLGCNAVGIDPDPFSHGVGRDDTAWERENSYLDIRKATAERIPFDDASFDVVFSSHVLEHIRDRNTALEEMKRILRPDGTLILGMPTASMAMINLVSQILFNTHKRFVHVLRSVFGGTSRYKPIHLLIPRSHSFRDETILYDLKTYRIVNWERAVSAHFNVERKILPALYPYPDFVQLFKLRKLKNFSSSVFFVCTK